MLDNSIISNTINTKSFAKIAPQAAATGSTVTNETINVTDKDTFDGNTVATGGIINVGTKAYATNNTVLTGGIINVEENGYAASNEFYEGSILSIANGGMAGTNNYYSGATCVIDPDGISVMDVIHNGATMTINGGIATELSVNGGNVILESNAYMDSGSILSGGNVTANSGAIIDSLTINSGGSATIANGALISSLDTTVTDSKITVAVGGTLTLDPSAGGIVNVTPGQGTNLIISTSGTTTPIGTPTTINGLSGATTGLANLTLAGVKEGDIASTVTTANSVTFTLSNGNTITLNITGADQIPFDKISTDTNGNLVYEVCFLTGTIINAGLYSYAVEDIQIGDKIMTYNWKNGKKALRSVTWTGKKHMVVNPSLSDDQAGYPIRVMKNAISDNVPNKDLLITPEHSLFFDDKFIPARMLVNNRSIYYDHSITSYDYYHIETKKHAVIISDGMMTESYLDTGNRKAFNQDSKIIDLSIRVEKNWEQDAAAPLTVSRDIVEPIYHQIDKRAHDMDVSCKNEPLQLTDNADIHLVTNTGAVIRNYVVQDEKIIFTIPSNTQFIKIMSRVGRSNETIGSFVDDRRYLGVLIGEIKISQANKHEIITIHHDADYLNGWDVKEAKPYRWTKGNAMLMLKPLVNTQEPIMISLQILLGGPYFVDMPIAIQKIA